MGFINRLLGRFGGAGETEAGSSEVFRIVVAFVAALSKPRDAITDVSRLPYPKPKIKEALVAAIGLAREEKMRAELRAAYVRLAEWQEVTATGDVSERAVAEARALSDELKSLT